MCCTQLSLSRTFNCNFFPHTDGWIQITTPVLNTPDHSQDLEQFLPKYQKQTLSKQLYYELSGSGLLTSLFFSAFGLSGAEPEPYFWFR